MALRRLLHLVAVGGALAVLWSSLKEPAPPPRPFLAGVVVGGEPVVVLGLPGPGEGRFEIRSLDGTRSEVRTGVPRAVAGTGSALVVLFDDGGAIFPLPVARDGALWRRVICDDPAFRPLAAAAAGDGVVVAGRREGEEDRLAWGRLESDGDVVRLEPGGLEVNRAAREILLVPDGETTWVAWQASGASGTLLLALPLGREETGEPRRLLEGQDLGAATALVGAGPARVLVLRHDGRVSAVGLAGGEVDTLAPDGLAGLADARLAAVGGREPRLLALAGARLVAWPLDGPDAARPGEPVALAEPPDLRWMLLGVAAAAAIALAFLAVLERRGGASPVDGPLELAGPGRRLVAWGLDVLLVGPPALVATGLLLGVDPGRIAAASPLAPPVDADLRWLVLAVDGMILLYFVVAEALFGRTVGKLALGLRTVGLDGGRARLPAVLIRNVLRMLVDMYGGAVLALVTERRQRVGDWLARTLVVRTRRAPRVE